MDVLNPKLFFLTVGLLALGSGSAVARQYPNFPVGINHDVFRRLPQAQQYAYLRDVTDALRTFIANAETIRDYPLDLDSLEDELESGEIVLPEVESDKVFVSINTWHMNVLLRFLSQLPINVATSDPTQHHLKRNCLCTNEFWSRWQSCEGIQAITFSEPRAQTIDYILAPRAFRVALALVDEYSDDLKLMRDREVITLTQLTEEVETGWGLLTLLPDAYSKYQGVFTLWQGIEENYAQDLVRRIDTHQIRARIETPRKPALLQLAPASTSPEQRFLWGTIHTEDRTVSNSIEDKLFGLLHSTLALFEANIHNLIEQVQNSAHHETLQAAEAVLIEQLEREFSIRYEPTQEIY